MSVRTHSPTPILKYGRGTLLRFIELRKEGETKARKKIARKMKSLGIFSNEFIAELVELDIKTIERIKANDEQSETRTS